MTNRVGGWDYTVVRPQIKPLKAVTALYLSAPNQRACAYSGQVTKVVPTWPIFTTDRNDNFWKCFRNFSFLSLSFIDNKQRCVGAECTNHTEWQRKKTEKKNQ